MLLLLLCPKRLEVEMAVYVPLFMFNGSRDRFLVRKIFLLTIDLIKLQVTVLVKDFWLGRLPFWPLIFLLSKPWLLQTAKDALLRRNIAVDPFCSLCSQDLETIDHLFFNCDFAKTVWRASHLGFDFTVGTALGFVDWFVQWLKHVPDKELIQDSIFIMWSIWRARNDVLFKSIKGWCG